MPTDIIATPTLVVNLAAVYRTPGHTDHGYFDYNVNGAINITHYA
jgi:hypothetical protein